MAVQRFSITEFTGVVTNPAEGLAQSSPTVLKGFDFARLGGYRRRFGLTDPLPTVTADDVVIKDWDDSGTISTYSQSVSRFGVLRSDVFATELVTPLDTTAIGSVVTIPGFGTYAGVASQADAVVVGYDTGNSFHVFDRAQAFAPTIQAISRPGGGVLGDATHLVRWALVVNGTSGQMIIGSGSVAVATSTVGNTDINIESPASLPGNAFLMIYFAEATDATPPVVNPRNVGMLIAVIGANESIWVEASPATDIVPQAWYPLVGKGFGIGEPHAEVHGRRLWANGYGRGMHALDDSSPNVTDPTQTLYLEDDTLSAVTLLFTEIGDPLNLWRGDYLTMPFRISSQITGLKSNPAGLIVFGSDETYLIRGDPAIPESFAVVMVSGKVGHDQFAGKPTALGGSVYCIYKGEVYALEFGMGDVDFGTGFTNVSVPVFNPDDHFRYVAAESTTGHIVCMTAFGRILRLDTKTKQWLTDVRSGVSKYTQIVPSTLASGAYYVWKDFLASPSGTLKLDHTIFTPSASESATLKYEGLDLGDKNLLKMWRRVEMFVGRNYAGTITCTYTLDRGGSGSFSLLHQGEGRFVGSFPKGLVSATADLEFVFAGDTSFVLEPPIHIDYIPRYRER